MGKKFVLESPGKPVIRSKKLAAQVDAFYAHRERRIAFAREVKKADDEAKAIKAAEDELAKRIARALRKQLGGSKISGDVGTFSPGTGRVFTVTDWEAFYEHIAKEDAFELLQKRIGEGAMKELDAKGELPPGVKGDDIFTYSLTKVSRKVRKK
jgi:hypothetical protein